MSFKKKIIKPLINLSPNNLLLPETVLKETPKNVRVKSLVNQLKIINEIKLMKLNFFSQNKQNNSNVISKLFKQKIDNSYIDFIPKLRHKHNALQPLPEIFGSLDKKDLIKDKQFFTQNSEHLKNPYRFEIDQIKPLKIDPEQLIPQKPYGLEDTPFKYIDSLKDLKWLCEHLNNRLTIKEIGLDLEHHSQRSYLGFTCLMQISTRTHDFVIDTIKLRAEIHRLNKIFTDSSLVKVMHGADCDIEWLQKDFGIYVVHMFDTCRASLILKYPSCSLSGLLKKFCKINTQKQYQLADWRQRPLQKEMIQYARLDTRYLIYIYEHLRLELSKTSQLDLLYQKCNTMCKKTYKKPAFITKNFMTLCSQNKHLNSKQMKALRDLHEWRDKLARDVDESLDYVLSNIHMVKLAELLPTEASEIKFKLSSHSTQNINEILAVIKRAKDYKGKFGLKDIKSENEQTEV